MWENGAQSTILNICCPDYVLALYFIICVYLNKLLYVLLSIEPMLNSYHHDSWMSNRAKQGTMKTEPTLPNHFHPIKQVQTYSFQNTRNPIPCPPPTSPSRLPKAIHSQQQSIALCQISLHALTTIDFPFEIIHFLPLTCRLRDNKESIHLIRYTAFNNRGVVAVLYGHAAIVFENGGMA